jgi:hypothetical protein
MSLPTTEFLRTASRTSLEQFELNRMAHATMLRKQILSLLAQWVDDVKWAEVAREFIENEGLRMNGNPLQETLDFPDGSIGGTPTNAAPMERVPINKAAD